MELFILLHEYGHVARGHLSAGRLRPAFNIAAGRLHEYTKSELQEFEADHYAVDKLMAFGLRGSDAALVAGLVLKFFALCEHVSPVIDGAHARTHPPSQDRWNRIRVQTGLSTFNGAFASNFDSAFATIIGNTP